MSVTAPRPFAGRVSRVARFTLLLVQVVAVSGCSFRQIAADRPGDALSAGTAFASNDDLEVIRPVVPALAVLATGVLAITYMPELSTWLPGLAK